MGGVLPPLARYFMVCSFNHLQLEVIFQNSVSTVQKTWAAIAQSVLRLAKGWTVRGSNSGGGEIFRTCPVRPWGPPTLLYKGYRVFPGCKSAGVWCLPPTPSSAEVKERVELYVSFLPGSSWSFIG